MKFKSMKWGYKDFLLTSPVYFPIKGDVKDKTEYPPYKIDVIKTEKCQPFKAYDMKTGKEKICTETSFVIGTIEWNTHEEDWDFRSCGTRWLEYSTTMLNRWVLDWCNNHCIDEDGELQERFWGNLD